MTYINGGSDTAGLANVDSNYNLQVNPPTTDSLAGFVAITTENDPGEGVGARYVRNPETSVDYRIRVGVDRVVDQEIFSYTVQNTGKYLYRATTLTFANSAPFLQTNGSNITTTTTAARLATSRVFGLNLQSTPLYAETNAALTASLAGSTNTTIDFGLFTDSAANPYAPTDGVYVRMTSSGVELICNFNSVEVSSGPVKLDNVNTFFPTIGTIYTYLLYMTNSSVSFWINDSLVATIDIRALGNPSPFMALSLPYAIRHAIVGGAAGNTQNLKVSDYSIFWGDVERDKPWSHVASAMGGFLQVQQGGTTGGQLTTYALGAAPTAVTLTASTAPATNTLGGLYLLPTTITAGESDYPLFAWLNPAATTTVQGKNFVVTGIRIGEQVVTTTLTGGPIMTQWAVGFGSTASSLATTETSSWATPTTKIARKIPLGFQTLSAVATAGTIATGFDVQFSTPITINPGEYFHVITRYLGTSISAGAIRGTVAIIGYFEV